MKLLTLQHTKRYLSLTVVALVSYLSLACAPLHEGGEHQPSSGGSNGPSNNDTELDPPGTGPGQELSFNKDILPIFEQRCSLCHSEGSGLPNWLDYEVSFSGKDLIRFRVFEDRSMPLSNTTAMTEDERSLVAAWIDSGAIE